jgi:hypothetical protein
VKHAWDTSAAHRILVEKHEGKRHSGNIGVDGDNIKMVFTEIEYSSLYEMEA